MTALDDAFAKAKQEGRKALLPFLMSGHPTPEEFKRNLEQAGSFADVIEVGVPFSDPLADGPVIQAAAVTGLKNKSTLASTLEVIRNRADDTPVVLMLSFNQVLAGGVDNFAAKLKDTGVSGAIIPDLPFGESDEIHDIFTRQGLVQISMLAPTSSHDRRRQILRQARGFVYLISVTGVTGTREGYPPETVNYIRHVTEHADVPTCVGFGISRREHIGQLREHTDGFIVGSALIGGIGEGRSVADVLKPLREACDAQPRPEGQESQDKTTV